MNKKGILQDHTMKDTELFWFQILMGSMSTAPLVYIIYSFGKLFMADNVSRVSECYYSYYSLKFIFTREYISITSSFANSWLEQYIRHGECRTFQ